MTIPNGISNCPPGLEYLTQIDQMMMNQKFNHLSTFTGYELNNKFVIKNSLGQNVSRLRVDNQIDRLKFQTIFNLFSLISNI